MSGKIRVTVVADVNDADYIQKDTDMKRSKLDYYKPVIKKLKEFDHYNFEKLIEFRDTEADDKMVKLIEHFSDDLMPWMDNQDVHTIESITYTKVTKNYKVL